MDELSVVETVDAGQAPALAARSVRDIPLGITRGMASDDYHAERSAVSSSQLKRMLVSPAHFMCGLNEPEESTEAMLLGTVLHGRMLESDSLTARFFAMPKVNWQTKVGNARMHDKARAILGTDEAEVALAWIDPETGIKCKIKIDRWHGAWMLADVKSAPDVTRDGFSKACARMNYALSAGMYCEGVLQLTGEAPEWAFITCEKEAPNTVAVYRSSDAFLRRGQQDFRRAMRRLAECRSRNHFPMLQGDGDWESIDLPRWARAHADETDSHRSIGARTAITCADQGRASRRPPWCPRECAAECADRERQEGRQALPGHRGRTRPESRSHPADRRCGRGPGAPQTRGIRLSRSANA